MLYRNWTVRTSKVYSAVFEVTAPRSSVKLFKETENCLLMCFSTDGRPESKTYIILKFPQLN